MKIGKTKILLKRGDITKEEVDAIVNAANSSLLGGGGVDGAIHRAGGSAILEECKKIGGCPTGEAVITTGGNLAATYVIHTVGPVWHGGGKNEAQLLRNAYQNSLWVALENNVKTIAFPSISTGVYRFPIEKASRIALEAVTDFIEEHAGMGEIRFILFSEGDLEVYKRSFTI